MSFRVFTWYCAAWGAAAAFLGWMVGRMIAGDVSLTGAAFKGLALGVLVALVLGLVDFLAAGSRRDGVVLAMRLVLALAIGASGGWLGGLLGQALYQLSSGTWPVLLILGWTMTGLLIGAAPTAFDFLSAVARNEDRRGARRKLRNGLIGGTVGGFVGGIVSLMLHGLWASMFKSSDVEALWSPSATGFVALGACIGLAVALAQIFLGEASLRVEAGFRPGRQVLLTRPETIIGRSEACDVGLFGDAGIEKIHAKISRAGESWILSDAGTPSGTLLNGHRLTEPAALRPGDRIQVGGSILSFTVRARETAAAAPVSA